MKMLKHSHIFIIQVDVEKQQIMLEYNTMEIITFMMKTSKECLNGKETQT